MSGAKRLPRQAVADSAVSAINDHAERIDDLVEERNVLTHRVNDIAERVEKLEKPSRLAQAHADLMEALDDKPKPAKSWAQRMRDAVFEERWRAQQGQGLDAAAIDTLIAEAKAAMKPEWRPMAAAPLDERIDDLADDQRIHGDRIEALGARVERHESDIDRVIKIGVALERRMHDLEARLDNHVPEGDA